MMIFYLGGLIGMRIAIYIVKIRTGTATSNGLGLPPSGPIRGVPNRWLTSFSLRLPTKGAALLSSNENFSSI